MLFASIIAATDPVAVLAVFEDVQVKDNLYIAVFGEALLNDAVSVALYNIFLSLSSIGTDNIIAVDVAAGIGSFCVVSLGGTVIGILFAALVAFSTRYVQMPD
jgi:NhaP-type Na+/H+ or K+/H+ antiporter